MRKAVLLSAIAGAGLLAAPAAADPVADFYKGKQVTMIVGYAAGGGFDFSARLVARHFGRYIPGHPTVIVQNMPGASSVKAANYLYAAAPKNGTVLGALGSTLALNKLLGRQGKYEVDKFFWIGRLDAGDTVGVVSTSTGVKSLKDLKGASLVWAAGGTSGPNFMVGSALKRLFGAKMKIVKGYRGSAKMLAAMENGEVQGTNIGWAALSKRKGYLLRNGKVKVIFFMGYERSPLLPDVPALIEAASNPLDRKVIRLLTSREIVGRNYSAPPGIPADRGAALRKAFDTMVKDSVFKDDLKKRDIPMNPLSGEGLQKVMAEVMQADPKTVARLKWAVKP